MESRATAAATSSPTSSNPQGSSALGKDEFVKLLMAQLAHQDPLDPMDNQAFVAQLAQFANIELQQTSNSSLEALLVAQTSDNQTSMASLIGKEATFRAKTVTLTAGQPVALQGNLTQAAASVTAVITDASGRTVRTLKANNQAQGALNLSWDGLDDRGNTLGSGTYSVQLTAADTAGKAVSVESQTRALVRGVSYSKGYAELLIGANNQRVALSDVVQLNLSP